MLDEECCPPTCGCCPGLGIPLVLGVRIEGVIRVRWSPWNPSPPYGGIPKVSSCDCDVLNGTFYPELIPDHRFPGDPLSMCWYHIQIAEGDLGCDGTYFNGDGPFTPMCEDCPPTRVDLWVRISCLYADLGLFVQGWVMQNAPDTPFTDGCPGYLVECIGLSVFTWSEYLAEEDPCVARTDLCDKFIDGVSDTLVQGDHHGTCTSEGRADIDENGYQYGVPGYTGHYGDPAWFVKMTVWRVLT